MTRIIFLALHTQHHMHHPNITGTTPASHTQHLHRLRLEQSSTNGTPALEPYTTQCIASASPSLRAKLSEWHPRARAVHHSAHSISISSLEPYTVSAHHYIIRSIIAHACIARIPAAEFSAMSTSISIVLALALALHNQH